MNKSTFIKILVGIVVVSVCFNFYQMDNGRDLTTELKDVRLRIKAKQQESDSIKTSLKHTQDSLRIAFNTIDVAHAETEKAKKDKLKAIKYYESIVYVRFDNDTLRARAVTELYPSYGNH